MSNKMDQSVALRRWLLYGFNDGLNRLFGINYETEKICPSDGAKCEIGCQTSPDPFLTMPNGHSSMLLRKK